MSKHTLMNALFDASRLSRNMPFMVMWYIVISNCYGITNLLLQNTENETFHKIYTTEICLEPYSNDGMHSQ